MRRFLTGNGTGRVDLGKEVEELVLGGGGGGRGGADQRTWVYISGPKQFIAAGKTACKNVQKKDGKVDFYAASWDP